MKILYFLTTFLLIQPFLIAQPYNTLDYLVLNNGDTLYGRVKHVNQKGVNNKYYKKIRLTNTNGNQKKYNRTDVSAFRVNIINYEGFWLNQSSEKIVFNNPRYDINSQKGEKYFLRVISKGKLSHYHLEWWEQGESGLMWMDLLKKEEDSFFIRATQGLFGLKKKVLINYFQNCPKLKEQIEQKQLKNIEQVVTFYKNYCL